MMRGDDLADFLQIHHSTLIYWHKHDILTVDDRAAPVSSPIGHPLYGHSSIEAHLRAYPNCPGAELTIPPLQELLVLQAVLGQPALMTREQAANWLEISLSALDRALISELLSIRLSEGGFIRVPLSALIDYEQVRRGEGAVPGKFAMKILGIADRKMYNISSGQSPLLKRQHVPGSHGEIYITTDSLMELIAHQVATGTAEEWWKLRCDYGFESLWTLETIRTTHHAHERTIRSAIDDGELPCLYLPGSIRRISRVPQHSVGEWTDGRLALPLSRLARLLGVGEALAAKWTRQRVLCDGRHGRTIGSAHCPSIHCVKRYIINRQMTPFDPNQWIQRAQKEGMPGRSSFPIDTPLSSEQQAILREIETGERWAIRLPNGDFATMTRPDAQCTD